MLKGYSGFIFFRFYDLRYAHYVLSFVTLIAMHTNIAVHKNDIRLSFIKGPP